ncbi:MAG: alpha-L-fucosidase [Planctomycetota bacterium]|nr:alpha-L-fucosidase [Planctomycetota bacterium]
MRLHAIFAVLILCLLFAATAPAQQAHKLALPTPEQVAWHDMEIEMFLCLDPCTWQDRERDNHSTPLKKINPAKLDTDQWARAAELMGARQIIFVAKHHGGFCWWQTETSDYGVKSIPWRGGHGDVVADLAESCRRRGIKLGMYLSPADDHIGAGNGGKCKTPEAQARYDKIFRQQLTELLSRYGQVHEVWFDGSCVVEVDDILAKYTPKAMIFQGPQATIRWVGNELGLAPYPAWNSVGEKDGRSGVATRQHGNPDGSLWLPLECDARIRSTWFWNSKNAHTLKSLDELMKMYYVSVGRGAVLLLNNTPDTTGLIPASDMRRTAEFGAEIRRRFGRSVGETSGDGKLVELDLGRPMPIDHVACMEDIRQGERVRKYVLEGRVEGDWRTLASGTAIGHKRIDQIEPVTVSRLRLRVIESAGQPRIRKLAVYNTAVKPVAGTILPSKNEFRLAGVWTIKPQSGPQTLEIDLSKVIREAAQFEVVLVPEGDKTEKGKITVAKAQLLLDGVDSPAFIEPIAGKTGFNLNITAFPTGKKGSIRLRASVGTIGNTVDKKPVSVKILVRKRPLE